MIDTLDLEIQPLCFNQLQRFCKWARWFYEDKIQASGWTFEILLSLGKDSLQILRESISIHSVPNSKAQTVLKKHFFNVRGIIQVFWHIPHTDHCAFQGCREICCLRIFLIPFLPPSLVHFYSISLPVIFFFLLSQGLCVA